MLLFEIGIIFLPFTLLFFRNFLDRGYIFSKTLGILAISWVVWMLGSLKIFPFVYENSWVVLGMFGVLALFVTSHNRAKLKTAFKASWGFIISEEILFFIALVSWAFVRGYQPEIRGLEKLMDFGFVNSILRSSYFPPTDMWFSGEHINYYYFGHLTAAVLTRLSGVASQISYNLMIATLFALTFVSSFSIGLNLYFSTFKKKGWIGILLGLVTAALVTLGSNLHPLYWIWKHGLDFSKYWYPDATRFIVQQFGAQDNTIHEFPIYSFVVADLHGHLINLPSVLLFVSALLSTVLKKTLSIPRAFFLSWLLGVFYITNAWDLPIYSALLGLAIFGVFWDKKNPVLSFSKSLFITVLIFLGSFAFNLPFQVAFKNISGGLGFADFHTPAWMLLVLWGIPIVASLSWIVFLAKQRASSAVVWLVGAMLLLSWVLVLVPEVIYVKDIYIHDYQRANTVFKFTYQAFVMFGIVAPYIFWCVVSGKKHLTRTVILGRLFYLVPVTALFVIAVGYSYFAVGSYYNKLRAYRTLDGAAWIKDMYPSEHEAIKYLATLPGQPVVLQAVGDSYTDFGVVSSYTGLPTIQGWLVHEWLWRGSFEGPGRRDKDVSIIYTTADKQKARELLQEYKVDYVLVGTLERQKYPTLDESKFKSLGELVFTDSGTKIYRIN